MPWVEAFVGGMDTIMVDMEGGRLHGMWRGQLWQFDFAEGGGAWSPLAATIPLGEAASTVMMKSMKKKKKKKKNTMKSMTNKSTQKNNMKKKNDMKKSMKIMKKTTR